MTRYQVKIHAERIPRGTLSSPSPYAEVKISGGPQEGQIVGETEVMDYVPNPEFTKTLFMDADPSVNIPFRVTIKNDRRNGAELGSATFEATEVTRQEGSMQAQQAPSGVRYVYVFLARSFWFSSRLTYTT